MNDRYSRFLFWIPPALALAGFAFKVWSALRDTGFVFDDAFMFSRYAHNLLHHGFYGWNVADGPAYGCTSILYTLWVTLIQAPGLLTPGQVVVVASASSSLLAVGLFGRIFLQVIPPAFPLRNWVGMLLLVSVAGNKLWMYHAVSGMDTMLGIALNAWLVLAVLQWQQAPDSRKKAVLVLVAAWASFATRPDNGLYITLFPVLYAYLVMRLPLQQTVLLALGLCGMLGVDTGLKYLYFGDPLPLPFYVKTSGFYEGYAGVFMWNPWRFLGTAMLLVFPWLATACVLGRVARWREAVALGVPLGLTVAYLFGVVQIMGYEGRFFLPGMVFVLALALVLLRAAWEEARWRHPVGLAAGLGMLVCAVTVWQYAADRLAEGYEARMLARHAQGSSTLFIEDSLPLSAAKYGEAETLAAIAALPDSLWTAGTEHGYSGAMLPDRNLFDMTGLHNKTVAHRGDPVRQLMLRKPAVISMPHHHYVQMKQALLHDPEFVRSYGYLPNLMFGVAVRNDQPELMRQLRPLDSLSRLERQRHWQHVGAATGQ